MAIVNLSEKVSHLAELIQDKLSDEGITNIAIEELNEWAAEYFDTVAQATTTDLETTQPDFELIVEQFQTKLQQRESWTDILTAGSGQTIIEFIANVGAQNEFTIQRALQENNLDTAILQSSILTIARSQGVHIQRNIPAKTTVTLNNEDTSGPINIPEYTQFLIDGNFFFNREGIIFNTGTAMKEGITLYQGEVVTLNPFTSSGQGFQEFELGDPDFRISDTDIFAMIDGSTKYERTVEGLWNFRNQERFFYENSTPEGRVIIQFGNNVYGRIPTVGNDIEFTYVLTDGARSNSSFTGLDVEIPDIEEITGTNTAPITEGANRLPTRIYKLLAPHMFNARQRAITRQDYRAFGLRYPGVIDVMFRGQRELAPGNKEYMNVVGVTILSDPIFTTTQYNNFVEYMEEYTLGNIEYLRQDPTGIPFDIEANIYVEQEASLTFESNRIQQRLKDYFVLNENSLGFSIYKYDVHEAIKSCADSIIYIELLNPVNDIIIDELEYVYLNNITLNVQYTKRKRKN